MNGPDEDYREFVKSRAAPLHRTAYLLCGDWHLADDLVQEALAKAFRHWRRVQRADNPDAYVQRILINEANRHWRRRRDVAPATAAEHQAAEHEAATRDFSDEVIDRAELLRALLSLPARQRATVVLRYLEGMSERETAAVLRCTEGTVKSQTFRALNTLKTVLRREELRR
jgi:RNA polymerase sigma-70 factor (sigma-E family)